MKEEWRTRKNIGEKEEEGEKRWFTARFTRKHAHKARYFIWAYDRLKASIFNVYLVSLTLV